MSIVWNCVSSEPQPVTMTSKFLLVVFVVLYFYTLGINGEDCVAGSVQSLRMGANSVLSWEVSPTEPCEVQEFKVDIVGNREDEYHFRVYETEVDLSFLKICEEWHFIVTPISNGVLGFDRRLVESVPLPPDADISLAYFYAVQIESRSIFMEWNLSNHTYGDCTLRYRVTVEDENQGTIDDFYLSGRWTIFNFLSPCVSYQLTVRAVNRAHPTIEGPLKSSSVDLVPHREEMPRLIAVDSGATTINTTWRLENPGLNRCPIRTLYVDGGNHFNLSLPLQDSDERPPVEVNLGGLRPNSMYYFRVSVENSGGISPAAPIAVQTKDLNPGSN